jgi:WD40 repeat protein
MAVETVVFSPDGYRVATASTDGSARVFDIADGIDQARFDHHGPVAAAGFSPDGTRIATASYDSSARVFETDHGLLTRRAIERLTDPLGESELRRYSLDPNARHIALWRSHHIRPSSA